MAFVAYFHHSGIGAAIQNTRIGTIYLDRPLFSSTSTPYHRQKHQAAASPCASRKGEHDNETFQTAQRHRYVVNKGYAGSIADVSMAWELGLNISRILGNDADSLGNSRQQLHRILSRIPHLEQRTGLLVAMGVISKRLASLVRSYIQSDVQELLHRCATFQDTEPLNGAGFAIPGGARLDSRTLHYLMRPKRSVERQGSTEESGMEQRQQV